MEPMLAAEPIEIMEATEPTEPIDKIDPADPIDKMDPAEPIDKIDPLEPMLRMDPGEPIERGAPSLFRMGSFSQPGRSSGPQVPAGGHTVAHPRRPGTGRQTMSKRTSVTAGATMRGASSSGLPFIGSSW